MAAAVLTGAGNVTTAFSNTGTSVVVSKPANIADLDLLVAVIHGRSSTAQYTTPPAGWVAVNPGGTRDTALGWQTFYYKAITAGTSGSEPSTYTWAGGGSGRHTVIIARVTGADLTTPIDAVGNNAQAIGGTPQTIQMPAVSPTGTNSLLLTGEHSQVTTGSGPAIMNPPAGITKIDNVTTTTAAQNNNLGMSYKQLSASGSTGVMVFSASLTLQSGLGYAIAIKSAAASNIAPTAAAGSDQTNVEPFTTVTLSGSGSTDSDGTIASYTWTQTAGSPTVTLSGSGATRTFSAPGTASGTTLTFGLVVTDNIGDSSTQDTVDVTMLAAAEFIRVAGAWVAAHLGMRGSGTWA